MCISVQNLEGGMTENGGCLRMVTYLVKSRVRARGAGTATIRGLLRSQIMQPGMANLDSIKDRSG